MYDACMPAIQIRNVSSEVCRALSARARSNGQSLQGFMLDLVEREASSDRNARLIDEIAAWPSSRSGGSDQLDLESVIDAARARTDVG